MKCPNCGTDSSGAFCSECGTPLEGAQCKECGNALSPGAKFCTRCGTAVRGRQASARSSNVAWYVAGAAALLLVGVLAWPSITGDRNNRQADGRVPIGQMPGGVPAGEGVGTGAMMDPLSGTPREQADRLFNRIMTEQQGGDTARAKFFTPMAIQAYGMVPNLDDDGLYHLSLVHHVAGDYKAARETAQRILAKNPDHLLALSAAANAAIAEGDKTAAKRYYEKFLAVFDSERKKDLPEYQDHGRMFPQLKTEAASFVK